MRTSIVNANAVAADPVNTSTVITSIGGTHTRQCSSRSTVTNPARTTDCTLVKGLVISSV